MILLPQEQSQLRRSIQGFEKMGARILVLGVKVPFTSGGQDALMRSLVRELAARGHTVDTIELPFVVEPKEQLINQAALWRAWDFGRFGGQPVDLLIATKFPSYYARGAIKSVWLVHEHRAMYDLYASRFSDFSDDARDEALREILTEGDKRMLAECDYRAAISNNVAQRVKTFHGLQCATLYPPLPLGNQYRFNSQPGNASSDAYVLSVGRICSIKRVDVMLKAMPYITSGVTLKIVGTPDEPGIMQYLQNEIAAHNISSRVEFLGRVSDEKLLELYANCLCVYYAPLDEDYGYVTLESMASGKPVIAGTDSGGVLEFVRDRENGLVIQATSENVALAVNELAANPALAEKLGRNGRALVQDLGFTQRGWDDVINGLLSPLSSNSFTVSLPGSTA